MNVRAKFKVDAIERSTTLHKTGSSDGKDIYEHIEIRTVKMSPVYGRGDPEHENTKFWNATPSGSLNLGCINLAASEYFELGKEYYLDFQKADEK